MDDEKKTFKYFIIRYFHWITFICGFVLGVITMYYIK